MGVDTSKIKYVAYARKSTDTEDKQVNSIDDQLVEIEKMGTGLNIVKTITESGSAQKLGRPGFKEMMKLIDDGKVQGVISWKINRLARNYEEGGAFLQRIRDGRVKHLKTSDGDLHPGDDLVMAAIHLGMADQFSLNLSKDVTRGMLSKARSGRRPGSAPLGYLNSKIKQKGEQDILPDPERWPIIRKMIDLILAGTHNVPQALHVGTHEWGLLTRPTKRTPRGKPLTKSAWYKLLQNPFIYGRFQYPVSKEEKEWINGTHKPMVTFEEFKRLQDIMGVSNSKRTKQTFAYMGLMRCGECGARITAELKQKYQKNGNRHEYIYYRCTGQVDPNCTQKSIRSDRLEAQIQDFLSSIQISPEFHSWALEELKGEYEREKTDSSTILHNRQADLDRVKGMLKVLLDSHLLGHIDAETFGKKKKELEEELYQLQAYMDAANEQASNWIEDVERLLIFAERAREEFDKGGLEKRRAILAALGTEHVYNQGILTLQVELPIQVLREGSNPEISPSEILEPAESVEKYTQKGTFVPSSEKMWTVQDLNLRPPHCK